MRVAVLGAKGMLGTDLLAALKSAGVESSGYDLPEIDITNPAGGLDLLRPCDWVVNCAAYTDVDGAEADSSRAYAINRDGVRNVAAWCRKNGAAIMHLSTDYIFDGTAKVPYREDSQANPLNEYGRSKLAGEQEVLSAGVRSVIIRAQSLFGWKGRNFIKAIVARLEKGGEPLRVVNDQVSSPTYTVHLACAILRLLNSDRAGIVNVAASGECSWYGFACAIESYVKSGTAIVPVSSADYVRPAKRPANSVLDRTRYFEWTGYRLPSWQQGLKEYMEKK